MRTYFGRVRPIPDIQSRNPNMRGFAERTAINTPLQGTAADLIKLAMIEIDAEITRRKLKSRMTLQVHDELLFDVVPEEAEALQQLVKHEMEHVAEFSVPIVADVGIGKNWRDIKRTNRLLYSVAISPRKISKWISRWQSCRGVAAGRFSRC